MCRLWRYPSSSTIPCCKLYVIKGTPGPVITPPAPIYSQPIVAPAPIVRPPMVAPLVRPAVTPVFDADPITPGIQSTPGVVTPVGPPRVVGGPQIGAVRPPFTGGFSPVPTGRPIGGIGAPGFSGSTFGGPSFVPVRPGFGARPF